MATNVSNRESQKREVIELSDSDDIASPEVNVAHTLQPPPPPSSAAAVPEKIASRAGGTGQTRARKARRAALDSATPRAAVGYDSDSEFEFMYTRIMYARKPPSRDRVASRATASNNHSHNQNQNAIQGNTHGVCRSSKGQTRVDESSSAKVAVLNGTTGQKEGSLHSLLRRDGEWVATQSGVTQATTSRWRTTPVDRQVLDSLLATEQKTEEKIEETTTKKLSSCSGSTEYLLASEPAAWPSSIIHLAENFNPLEIAFSTRRPYFEGKCDCVEDCRNSTCTNASQYIFCDASCCSLGGRCSNGREDHADVRLVKAPGSDEYAIIAAADIDEGVVLGEYLGELFYEEGRGGRRAKNEGYRVHFKVDQDQWGSTKVGIDGRTKGSLMRFANHSCTARARFYEHGNGDRRAIVVVTTKKHQAGEEITVNYGNDLWFKCRCRTCKEKKL